MTHACIRDWYIVRAVATKGASEMQMQEMYARGTLGGISMLIINVSPLKLVERSISRCLGKDSDPVSREIHLYDAYDSRKL